MFPTLILKLYALYKSYFPLKAGKTALFHDKFNENDIYFSLDKILMLQQLVNFPLIFIRFKCLQIKKIMLKFIVFFHCSC
jgi:hypothetical protein